MSEMKSVQVWLTVTELQAVHEAALLNHLRIEKQES